MRAPRPVTMDLFRRRGIAPIQSMLPWILCSPNCPHDPDFESIQKFVYKLQFYTHFRKVSRIHVLRFKVGSVRFACGSVGVTFDFAPLLIPASENFAQLSR